MAVVLQEAWMGVREGSALAALRTQIAQIEGRSRRGRSVLPFGVRQVDAHLPGGGLALGALHEVAGGGNGASTAPRPPCSPVGSPPARAARCCGA